MQKIALLLSTTLLLVACQNNLTQGQDTTQTQSTQMSDSAEAPATVESAVDSSASSVEHQDESSVSQRGIRQAWTDYSSYAEVDDAGYAYYIYNDPDISSEIFPLSDVSSERVVLFTFDDAPAPDSYAVKMAELMKEKDVNAIFLVNGMYLEDEYGQEITKTIYDMGFEIGNHTQTHANLRELSYEEQYAEINRTSEMVEEITGEAPRWFRPPFGLYNMDTLEICNDLGMQLMTWSFGYDWMDEYLDGDALAEVSLNNKYLRPGNNILMHDRPWTYEALEEMIDGYRAMGLEIVDPLLIKHQENNLEVHGIGEDGEYITTDDAAEGEAT